MEEKNTNPIDFVIIWVDGNDKQWQEEKAKYDAKLSPMPTVKFVSEIGTTCSIGSEVWKSLPLG